MNDKIIIGIPGFWEDRSSIVGEIAKKCGSKFLFAGMILMDTEDNNHVEMEIYEYDKNLKTAFETASQGKIKPDILNKIENHKQTIYLFFNRDDKQLRKKKIFIKVFAFINKILTPKGAPDETPIYIKIIFWILLYLPAIAISFIIVSDILSIYFLYAPFRSPQLPLINIKEFREEQISAALIMDSIALIALFFTANFCRKASNNEKGTEKILKEYEELVKPKKSDGKKDV